MSLLLVAGVTTRLLLVVGVNELIINRWCQRASYWPLASTREVTVAGVNVTGSQWSLVSSTNATKFLPVPK